MLPSDFLQRQHFVLQPASNFSSLAPKRRFALKQTRLLSACLTLLICALFLPFSNSATAQQLDVAFGMNTLTAPSASAASGNHTPQSLTGGAYPSFSADVLFFKNIGIQGEFAWKASRGIWQDVQPYRPMFYDFNAIFVPKIADRTYLELLAGIGSEATRFYQPFQVCDFNTCKNFVTINHFMGHFGVGLKAYPFRKFFVRPEAHLYLVNDNQEFSSGRAVRYGISIGYTFGGR